MSWCRDRGTLKGGHTLKIEWQHTIRSLCIHFLNYTCTETSRVLPVIREVSNNLLDAPKHFRELHRNSKGFEKTSREKSWKYDTKVHHDALVRILALEPPPIRPWRCSIILINFCWQSYHSSLQLYFSNMRLHAYLDNDTTHFCTVVCIFIPILK